MNTERRLSDSLTEFARSELPLPKGTVRIGPIVVLTTLLVLLTLGTALQAQEASPGLGSADDFAVLAGESITNTGPTTITGDVGLHPGSSVTGFAAVTLSGELHVTDTVAEQAKVDLVTAYNDAVARGPATTVADDLGGQNLTGGVYDSASGAFQVTGALTLDAQGDANAVFVFQMASTLVTASASSVNLINGAQACNVFWQVGSSATLGTGTSFVGNILALASITLDTGATVEGRTLARNGSVTLDSNTITRATCATQATTTTTTQGTTTTNTGATSTTALASPVGGVDTGGGSTAGAQNLTLLVGGVALLALAGGAFVVRQRLQHRRQD